MSIFALIVAWVNGALGFFIGGYLYRRRLKKCTRAEVVKLWKDLQK